MDSTLQSRLHIWRQKNFPNATAEEQLLGIVEEVGELAHAVLKRNQGIRGTTKEHNEAILDAIGDIQVFLAGFCSYEQVDMQLAFQDVANEVTKRDWIKYPENGFPRPDQVNLGSKDVKLASGETVKLSNDPEDAEFDLDEDTEQTQ